MAKTVYQRRQEELAAKNNTTITQEQASGMSITELSKAMAQPVASPVPATEIAPTPTVNLPEPEAMERATATTKTIQGEVDIAKENLKNTLTTQQTKVDSEIKQLQKEQDDILKKGEQLTQPFREKLEKKERERLHINDNFEANQKLTGELDGLLTQANELIEIATGRQVSGKVLQKSLSKTMADVQGRAGVIQAVMNARNNQISQAYTMIDRTVDAVVADRNDQLSYYNTLLELNNNGLIKLSAESAKIAETQRSQAVKEVDNAQATADYLKELMISPETAQFMADAGVSLTDTVDGVKSKMAVQAKRQEAIDMRTNLVEAGYEISPVPVPGGIEVEAGGKKIYAKVRKGSELDFKLQDQQAAINQKRASARASNASAARTETGRLIDLASAGDPAAISALGLTMEDNTTPTPDLIAYASDYATTGKLPTASSLPKGISVGDVAELAYTIPKPDGAIVSTHTGVPSTGLTGEENKAITAMNEIVNDSLPFMLQKWDELQRTNLGGTGITGGIASKIIPSQAMTQYEQAREEFLAKLLVARSGAAVTEQEYARYSALVPGAFNSALFLGHSGETKLDNLSNLMEDSFDNYLTSNQLSVHGYSKIDNGEGGHFVVGEEITNEYGQSGIVQPNGTVVLINP